MKDEATRLREVCDRQEIEYKVRLYCRAIDRLDVNLLKSLYHPDGIDLHGNFEGNAHDFADFIMKRIAELTTYGFHSTTQSVIDIEGDIAAAETTYIAYHRIGAGWGPISTYFGETYAAAAKAAGTLDREHENSCGGRYLDRFERRNGEWKIAKRRITNEWNRNGPTSSIYTEGEMKHFDLPGARDKTDPVYDILLGKR
ncbi:MAG: nuclear transport factor 2 family protein [Caulobacterales bacterium]